MQDLDRVMGVGREKNPECIDVGIFSKLVKGESYETKIVVRHFGDDHCKAAHAAWYAAQLQDEGHEVAVVLDGPALSLLNGLDESIENYEWL